ncbi:nuclear distribution protein nudE homolog isoform X2 [Condylostylus longicornis]|uniref:nuclear distribution protein nudE homolog isoform X2 n=1 Tax=Condylostylus longicornis TaxID=2530218 RepID=UPI00244DF737|nr:nuclear distribution protein nudE homolog isoform X2 [Condylostylus longicornis]
MEQPPIFNSVEDECRYWKERAKLYHKEWTDVKQEFDEFVEDSRQLEAEMEATLEQKETAVRDLRKQVIQLEKENESLRIKSDSHSIEFSELEKQLSTTQSEKESLKSYLRQLEQKNDDLERAHRILLESISSLKTMLDKEYEKNALESDEKELLKERLQRLMDERRDLEQELNVRHRISSSNMNGSLEHSINGGLETPPPIATNSSTTGIGDYGQHSLKNPENMLNGNAMTASSRTTALNIVADMLRKLNAMESKLKAYREQVPPPRQ